MTGQLDQEAFYQNGLTHGTVKNWFPSGQIRLKSHYENGQKQGQTVKWFANGQKKSLELFKYDEQDGESRFWDKKGILRAVRIYEKGKLIKDINYRSGNINIGNGYLQVYNEAESFFKVPVTGDQVRPVDQKNITYVVDGSLLQLFNIRWREFLDTTRTAQNDEELLRRYLDFETDLLKETTPDFAFDIQTRVLQHPSGKTLLHWYFKAPSSETEDQTPRTILEEHYVSMVCNQQILSLYSAVTRSDDPSEITDKLLRIAKATEIAKERIDLNQIIAELD